MARVPVPDSLEPCYLVMREDCIRNFWVFTCLESFGYLCGKLGFLDKYHAPQKMRSPMLNVTAEDPKHIFAEQPTSLIRFAPLIYFINLKIGLSSPWNELENFVSLFLIQPSDYAFL